MSRISGGVSCEPNPDSLSDSTAQDLLYFPCVLLCDVVALDSACQGTLVVFLWCLYVLFASLVQFWMLHYVEMCCILNSLRQHLWPASEIFAILIDTPSH